MFLVFLLVFLVADINLFIILTLIIILNHRFQNLTHSCHNLIHFLTIQNLTLSLTQNLARIPMNYFYEYFVNFYMAHPNTPNYFQFYFQVNFLLLSFKF